MEEMIKDLPWNSIEDFWCAIESGRADMSMMRSTIFHIAKLKHPFILIFGLLSPYLISSAILITLCIVLSCPLAILLILPNIIYALFAFNLKNIHNLFIWSVIILSIFFNLPIWLFVWVISIYLCKMIDSMWYIKAYKYAFTELRYNSKLFSDLYLNGMVVLYDIFGNLYRHNPYKDVKGDATE